MRDSKRIIELGFIEHGTGQHESNTVYDSQGLSPCQSSTQHKNPTKVIIQKNKCRITKSADSKKLKLLGNLGVGGGERRCVLDEQYLPFTVGDTTQRCNKDSCIYVGNVNKGGIGQFGYVYSEDGLSPTIVAGTHGYCIGHILVFEVKNETDSNCRWTPKAPSNKN